MSGHSKWHNIQAKKGKADSARGKIFTKLGREILMAVKAGGPDPNSNSKLKDVVAKCKSNNMPNDTINNAIKKAAGSGDNKIYEEITYEGYGPNGIAIIVNVSTDNKNRMAAELRHIFDRSGGNLGTPGCVSYMFAKKGVFVIAKSSTDLSEEDLMMIVLDCGAENLEAYDDYYEITTATSDFSAVREALEAKGLTFEEADVQMIPNTCIPLDEEGLRKLDLIVEKLEELDDVIEVFHNGEE